MEEKEKPATVEKQILEVINWYNNTNDDFTGIAEIAKNRKKLAILIVRLSVEMGEAKKNYKLKELGFKKINNQRKIRLLDKYSMAKADVFLRANPLKEEEIMIKWELFFYQKEILFKSVKEVLNEMNQRVSNLKEEKKQIDYFENANKEKKGSL